MIILIQFGDEILLDSKKDLWYNSRMTTQSAEERYESTMATLEARIAAADPTTAEVLRMLHQLLTERAREIKALDVEDCLTPKERRKVEEFCENPTRKLPGNNPLVHVAVEKRMDVLDGESKLRACYVRDYIYDVLELCPTDYFQLAPNGDWCISPRDFDQLPKEVKRLVEGIELRRQGPFQYVKVSFLSKQAALALAARYTLTQKAAVSVSAGLPWAELQVAERAAGETIEMKLKAMAEGST
jgi:hypothetical protein